MKTPFFAVCLFIFITGFAVESQAQQTLLTQGKKFLGGSFFYSNADTETASGNQSASRVSLSPAFGYFLTDRWAIGLIAGYISTNSSGTGSSAKTTVFAIEPFARYYKAIKPESFYFYMQASAGAGTGTQETNTNGVVTESGVRVTTFTVSPGFAFFPSEKWAIELTFQGIVYRVNNPDGSANTATTLQFGIDAFSPSVGMYFYF